MNKKIVTLISSLVCILSANVLAADLQHGEKLYQRCAICHGDKGQGNDALNAPSLAGQKKWYIERQLQNFIDGTRGSNPKDIYGLQMRPMALGLTEKNDISDVSAYIEKLLPVVEAKTSKDE